MRLSKPIGGVLPPLRALIVGNRLSLLPSPRAVLAELLTTENRYSERARVEWCWSSECDSWVNWGVTIVQPPEGDVLAPLDVVGVGGRRADGSA